VPLFPWERNRRIALAVVALASLLSLLPFVDKAFHIDDPLFLWTARQIQTHPLDFYGFTVNWYVTESPMHQVMKNPPLCSYYIAAMTAVFGWGEPTLHLAFLFPAIAAIWGTYVLAERFCQRPLIAALATLWTPAFLVSSTNVMCDTMLLCFWIWALVYWEWALSSAGSSPEAGKGGLAARRMLWLWLAAVLVCLSALTKYFGMSLLPLLVVYGWARTRKAGWWLLPLVLPVGVLAGYQIYTAGIYGHGLLSDAAGFAGEARTRLEARFGPKTLVGLAFAGGCTATALFYAPLVWSRNVLIGAAIVLVVSLIIISGITDLNQFEFQVNGQVRWEIVGQMALAVLGGLGVLGLAVADLKARRDPQSLLLALWVAGTFVFAVWINWVINARTLLPLAPAVGILLARRMEDHQVRTGALNTMIHRIIFAADSRKALPLPLARPANTKKRQRPAPTQSAAEQGIKEPLSLKPWLAFVPLLPAAIVALLVACGDYLQANSARKAAENLFAQYGQGPAPLWFQGHWGFQYYMEQLGAVIADAKYPKQHFGDRIVLPTCNTSVWFFLPDVRQKMAERGIALRPIAELEQPTCPWLATTSVAVGGGFYSDDTGPLPFVFTSVEPDRYWVREFEPSGGLLPALPRVRPGAGGPMLCADLRHERVAGRVAVAINRPE
jgi:4-amino-4-deoxy-L-arabinose transferase-like glycosyltransferase